MQDDIAKIEDDAVLGFSELMNLALSFHSRVDTLWQRVLYTHAAIVGVMVFFAATKDPLVVPRLLVFFFYTLNIGVTIAAFNESYSGLKAVLEDLKKFPDSRSTSNVQGWVLQRSYHRHALRRVWSLAVVWLVLGYLLVYPIIIDVLFG